MMSDNPVSEATNPELEACYIEHGEYLQQHVFPHLTQPLTILMEHVRVALEKGDTVAMTDEPVAWLAHVLRTDKAPQRKRVIRYNSPFPLRAHLNPIVLADSYKTAHFLQYPESRLMSAYGEFRKRMAGADDDRVVVYGVRHIVEEFLHTQWTLDNVDDAALFFATHGSGFTPHAFPRELFEQFVRENNGYFPIRFEALLDGTVVHTRTPVYQITAKGEYAHLVTYLETVLTHIWYPTCVATLSRRIRSRIEDCFDISVDDECKILAESRLIDYGMGGCSTVDQATIGGCAHLLSFTSTANTAAAFYAQKHLNKGTAVATGLVEADSNVVRSWPTQKEAVQHLMNKFGDGKFVLFVGAYDHKELLESVGEEIATELKAKNGSLYLRLPSEDSVETAVYALSTAEQLFGADKNRKGYKVLKQVTILLADGMNYATICAVLDAAMSKGFSAQNLVFGMGTSLLQLVNRDTMSFATKLNFIEYEDGSCHDVMKKPKTDPGKISFPGYMSVMRDDQGIPMIYPSDPYGEKEPRNLLTVLYDHQPVRKYWESFESVRTRINEQWQRLPPRGDPLSEQMVQKIAKHIYGSRPTSAKPQRSQEETTPQEVAESDQ